MHEPLDIESLRSHFPALQRADAPVYLDNPAGTQIVREAMDAMQAYMLRHNANSGGRFATSQRSDVLVAEARAAMADFLGAGSADEIAFGPNMTTLTYGLSRAFGRTLQPGDEIVVTRLDHDANIAPWLALEELGAVVRWVDVHPEDCSLDMESLAAALSERSRLVAVGMASNAVGSVNDVQRISRMAHEAGALVFVDAVHYAPHGPIDVGSLDCDFLTCSVYKFFGPHVGALWGRAELLERLPAYKVRPAGEHPPGKFETGTQNHEGIAGTLGTLRYLEGLGDASQPTRRQRLRSAMQTIRIHEQSLSRALLDGLEGIRGVKIWGITDRQRLTDRVPTVSFTLAGRSPRQVAEHLARQRIQVWDGNYYALAIMERLDLQESGGMVRVGAVHYNRPDEIASLVNAVSA